VNYEDGCGEGEELPPCYSYPVDGTSQAGFIEILKINCPILNKNKRMLQIISSNP
jgi:hypothetical protein